MQFNSSMYYGLISSDAPLNTAVLNFILYLNNTYYQTPASVTLQLGGSNQFTLYFSFRNTMKRETILFNVSSSLEDQLIISRSILYTKQAPPGVYQTILSATVRTREEIGLNPLGDIQNSTVTVVFKVTKGKKVVP